MSYVNPDGKPRSLETERKLNEAVALTFSTEAGKLVLAYLKNITINSVAGPGVDPNHLMHLEGQRFIVGLIEQRQRYGQDDQPKKEPLDGPRKR